MVAIAYGKGVIAAKKYNGGRNAEKFFSIVLEHFVHKPMENFFLQAGDLSEISDKSKSAWCDVGRRELTISARCPDQNPIKNIFHIGTQRLHQEDLDWNLFHWQEKLWNYYINQKEKGLNTGFFVHEKIFRRIEFCLKIKCLVIWRSYTLLFEECIMKAKRFFHGIRFSIFY